MMKVQNSMVTNSPSHGEDMVVTIADTVSS
jgi:hypothetical protein